MKKTILITLFCCIFFLAVYKQEKGNTTPHLGFENYSPLRELQGELWINSIGDIAYMYIGCDEDSLIGLPSADVFIPSPVIQYRTWAYDIPDIVPDDISGEDFDLKYTIALRDVVDTASLKFLSLNFFMDKNFIYRYQTTNCVGQIFIDRNIDRETFRIFEESPIFACDKNGCYAEGKYIENADPETFRPFIILQIHELTDGAPTPYARDKNHIYYVDEQMSEAEIIMLEQQFRIKLRENP